MRPRKYFVNISKCGQRFLNVCESLNSSQCLQSLLFNRIFSLRFKVRSANENLKFDLVDNACAL